MAYLAAQIPASGTPKLDGLRQQILDTSVIDAMARMKAQGMSVATGIELANKQADADEANLTQIEQTVHAAVQQGGGDSVMQMLRNGHYGYSSDASDVLSAAESAYLADAWGALANRETAKQFACYQASSASASTSLASRSGVLTEGTHGDVADAVNQTALASSYAGRQTGGGELLASPSPSLDETTQFIKSHIVLGSALESYGQLSGDRTERVRDKWTWQAFSIDGCSLSSDASFEVLIFKGSEPAPRNNVEGFLGPRHTKLELKTLSPADIKVFAESDEVGQRLSVKGAHVVASISPDLFKVGRKQTSIYENWKLKTGSSPMASYEEMKKDYALHPEHYEITKTSETSLTVLFVSQDRSLAERIAKAARHAVELCGGKPEAF